MLARGNKGEGKKEAITGPRGLKDQCLVGQEKGGQKGRRKKWGKRADRLGYLCQGQAWLHLPPAPPWSPLAALAKPRLKTLRGRAIAKGL